MDEVIKALARVPVVFVLEASTSQAQPITCKRLIFILQPNLLFQRFKQNSRNCLYWVHLKRFLLKFGGPNVGSEVAFGVVSSGSFEKLVVTAGTAVEDGGGGEGGDVSTGEESLNSSGCGGGISCPQITGRRIKRVTKEAINGLKLCGDFIFKRMKINKLIPRQLKVDKKRRPECN